MNKDYYVYMFLDKDENPLYIGSSFNLVTRIEQQHFLNKNGNLVEECIIKTYKILYHKAESYDDMMIKERYLINTLDPIFNIKLKNNSKFSFKIDFEWNLYSVDTKSLIEKRKKRSRKRLEPIYVPIKELLCLSLYFPSIDNDFRHPYGGYNPAQDDFYLFKLNDCWYIWCSEIDNLYLRSVEITHVTDFDIQEYYDEELIKGDFIWIRSHEDEYTPFQKYGYNPKCKGEMHILNPNKRLFLNYNKFKKMKLIHNGYIDQIELEL